MRSPLLRMILSVALLVLLLLAVPLPAANAAPQWCEDDPPVTVWVNGRPVTVNVRVAVPIGSASQLRTARATAAVDGTTVTVNVTVPGVRFRTSARIAKLGLSSGNGDVVHGAGNVVTLTFTGVQP